MSKKDDDLARIWKRRLASFLTWRDEEIDEDQNRRFVEFYQSEFWRSKGSGPRAGVPLVFAYVDVKMSALDGKIGEFEAVPRSLHAERVNRAEALLNYEAYHLNWRREWQKAHLAAHLTDYGGWLKIGWDAQYGPVRVEDDDERVMGEDGKQVEHDVNVRKDHPWVKHIEGKDVAFDTTATELTDAKWMATRYSRSVGDLSRDKRVTNSVAKDLVSAVGGGEDAAKEKVVDCWEIWDAVERKVYHLCPKVNTLLYAPRPWPFDLNGFPLVHLKFMDAWDKKSERIRPIFGMASIRPWFSLNEQRNQFRTNALITSDRLVPKYIVERDTFDLTGKQVFESRTIAAAITVRPGKQIRPLDAPSTRPDDRHTDQLVLDDYRFASGVAEQQAGVGGADGDTTATEIVSRERASGSRTGLMASKYDEFLSDMARKVLILLKLFWPKEREFPIIDSLASGRVVGYTEFSDEWKLAEYDIVRIKPDSARPRNEAGERQAAIQLGNTLAQLGPQLMQMEMLSKQTFGEATFSAMGFLQWFMPKLATDIPPGAMEEIFPTLDQQDPEKENLAMFAGGDAIVLPEDVDQRHVRSHVRFLTVYQDGEYGEPQPEVIHMIQDHITEHMAAQAIEQGALMQQGQEQGQEQGQQPQAGQQHQQRPQGEMASMPGSPAPGDIQRFAQPEQNTLQGPVAI